MSQYARRRDPYPWTWEVPAGVVLVILVVLVCGVHFGRAIANVLASAGWALPGRIELFRSLTSPATLGAGLSGLSGHSHPPHGACLRGGLRCRLRVLRRLRFRRRGLR